MKTIIKKHNQVNMKVAIIGTVGVPANYGGFETLVENLLTYKSNPDIQYEIFCSSKRYKNKIKRYKGAKLTYLSLDANGTFAPLYDMVSLAIALSRNDVILALGTACSPLLKIIKPFTKKNIIINLDGIDTNRAKVKGIKRRLLEKIRKIAAQNASICISDNQGIIDFVSKTYHRDSVLIEYGGDNAFFVKNDKLLKSEFNLVPQGYSFKVARIEPENNIELILQAYSELPNETLVIVGNWNRSEFGIKMKIYYSKYPNIHLIDAIYDSNKLNLLRSNCKIYIHGHSVGGTNPSLVEAMSLKLPIVAFDVIFNKETTENKCLYFSDKDTLKKEVSLLSSNKVERDIIAAQMLDIAKKRYTWELITKKYENLY